MKPFDRLFGRRTSYQVDRRLSSKVVTSAPNSKPQTSGAVMLGNVRVLFGLDWTTASTNQTPEQFLQHERKRGRKSYVEATGSEMIGLSDLSSSAGLYSAAVYLSETVSRGESEFFVFDLTDSGRPNVAGVVALVDRLPIPGFDCICSHEDVPNLLTEFWGLQPKKTVRVAGILASVEGIEQIKPGRVFDGHLDTARMNKIPNPAVRLVQAIGVFVLFAAVGLGYLWHQERRARELSAQAERIPDPNIAYEAQVVSQLASVGLPGSVMIKSWLSVLGTLPTSLKGWELAKITCVPTECRSTWRSIYGSYDDLLSSGHLSLSDSTVSLPFLNSLRQSHVEFRHSIPTPDGGFAIDRDSLPSVLYVQRKLGSMLQDYLLLGSKEARLSNASLFGGSGANITQINKPVVKGNFAIELPFSLIQEFRLPPYCVPTAMSIDFPPDMKGRFHNVFFNIQGDFYAKGKVY
jgi:hypothetical protein